jgi:hypothetical protein
MITAAASKTRYPFGLVLLVLLACGLGLVAGCGNGSETTQVTVRTPDADSEPVEVKRFDQALETAETDDCEAKPCTEHGVNLVVAGGDSSLKLKELNATLLKTETTKSVSDRFGTTKTADGTYVILWLKTLIKLDYQTSFDGNFEQAYLYLNGQGYSEDFEVENYALESSFANKLYSSPVRAAVKGTIAFDVPSNLAPELKKSGSLILLNSSEEGQLETAKQIGIIRTYK